MNSPILQGFQSGFNMMERHNARIGREERQEKLDNQNQERYQDGILRQLDLDNQSQERYQDGLDRQKVNDKATADHRSSMLNESQKRTANQEGHYQWKQNAADEQKKWALIAPQLENIHTQYFKDGTMPEQAKRFFTENPEYSDYSPESFRDPEYVKSAKLLRDKTTKIFKSGALHEFKSPEYIEMFNGAFKSKIQQGVGEMDYARNAKITNKRVAQLIPTRNGKVSIGLEVTYQGQDGKEYTEIQPMTRGRTAEKEDPVNEWELKELLSAIETRSSMADLALNGENYQARSEQTLGALKSNKTNSSKSNYRKEKNSIKKELRKAESEANKEFLTGDERVKFLKPYNDALTEIDQAYGVNTKKVEQPKKGKYQQYQSNKEGVDVETVISKFMSANKGMTEEQAIAAATNQGYLTNDE